MYYKEENSEWFKGLEVITDSYTLDESNKDLHTYPVDGWNWYDNEPIGYTNWLNSEIAAITPPSRVTE